MLVAAFGVVRTSSAVRDGGGLCAAMRGLPWCAGARRAERSLPQSAGGEGLVLPRQDDNRKRERLSRLFKRVGRQQRQPFGQDHELGPHGFVVISIDHFGFALNEYDRFVDSPPRGELDRRRSWPIQNTTISLGTNIAVFDYRDSAGRVPGRDERIALIRSLRFQSGRVAGLLVRRSGVAQTAGEIGFKAAGFQHGWLGCLRLIRPKGVVQRQEISDGTPVPSSADSTRPIIRDASWPV